MKTITLYYYWLFKSKCSFDCIYTERCYKRLLNQMGYFVCLQITPTVFSIPNDGPLPVPGQTYKQYYERVIQYRQTLVRYKRALDLKWLGKRVVVVSRRAVGRTLATTQFMQSKGIEVFDKIR